jgi:hypothetical protein
MVPVAPSALHRQRSSHLSTWRDAPLGRPTIWMIDSRNGSNTCRTPTRARCPQLHQHRKCRRTSIGRSIRRRARSCRPQGTNAVGERARMHRGRGRLAARTIDVRCLRSPSVSYHQGCISRYRPDVRSRNNALSMRSAAQVCSTSRFIAAISRCSLLRSSSATASFCSS